MNREEFMRELEYLLQDIPDEEKEEALAYYRDYLEDAGDENEAQAIRDFGSPERVAAIIRSDLMGGMEQGGEFTESGYQDERFRDPNYQMVKRQDLPEAPENGGWNDPESGWSQAGSSSSGRGPEEWNTAQNQGGGRNTNQNQNRRQQDINDRTWFKRLLKVGLLLVILGVAAPIILGVGGSMLGMAVGILGLIVGAVLLIGVLTVTVCLGAVALLVVGAGLLFTNPWSGVLVIGFGVLALGLGLIGIALSILIYGQFIPWAIRTVVDLISRIFHGGRRNAA